jgi:glycosyltransferase involved in cell wall biosynthesis
MRIAQVAPLIECVPPKAYGGTERVVSWLTEELVKQGHEVILFASGDSQTKAELIAGCPQALRLDTENVDKISPHMLMVEKVFQLAKEFDVIHSHLDYFPFSLARRSTVPCLTTLHGRLDINETKNIFREFREMPFVSISNSQRLPLLELNWQTTIYHGLPEDLYSFHEKQGNYLLFLGRISPEKRLDRAIEIAKRFGMPIKVGGKIDEVDKKYYQEVIAPLIQEPYVEYLGEVFQDQKNDLIGNAYAMLFPIDWPEPFGLVMIESMACGTPVIAFHAGSVPEIIQNGISGFICNSVQEAVEALTYIPSINRKHCRAEFEKRFSASQMAKEYLSIYEKISLHNNYTFTAADNKISLGV